MHLAVRLGNVTSVSQRQRSKERRKRTIQYSAMHLFAEQGYDATTVADIAVAAEVAPRTVALYFPSKLAIALASADAAAERLLSALHEPNVGGIVDAVAVWFHRELDEIDVRDWELRAAMYLANPTLAAMSTHRTEALGNAAAAALAVEMNLPASHDAVRLTTGAFAGLLHQFLLLPVKSVREPATAATALAAMRAWLVAMNECLHSTRGGAPSGNR